MRAGHPRAARPDLFRGEGAEDERNDAGCRSQAAAAQTDEAGLTKAKAEKFLTVLAETCNIARSCEAAGVSQSTIRRKRKSDASFRAGFMMALAGAYERFELVLLERFFNGTEKVVVRKDGSEERMRELFEHAWSDAAQDAP